MTEEWLLTWRTERGGYTRKQLRSIGVPWPPPKGWKLLVRNKMISEDVRDEFQREASK